MTDIRDMADSKMQNHQLIPIPIPIFKTLLLVDAYLCIHTILLISDNLIYEADDSSKTGASVSNIRSPNVLPSSLFIAVLQEIGRRCESKVEFRPIVASSTDINFSVEVLFSTERIGFGMGKTRKEAQLQAAENALRNLERNYISVVVPNSGGMNKEKDKLSLGNENGFLEDIIDPASNELSNHDHPHGASTSERLGQRLSSVLSSIKELCVEGENLVFQEQVPASVTIDKGEYYFQVELAGHILGKGIASSREEAKFQAAEEALKTLKTAVGHCPASD